MSHVKITSLFANIRVFNFFLNYIIIIILLLSRSLLRMPRNGNFRSFLSTVW